MGCGCKGGGDGGKPKQFPRTQGGLTPARTQADLRQGSTDRVPSPNGLTAARLQKEAERRAAIRKALGKG